MADKQLCYMHKIQYAQFYTWTKDMLQAYSQHFKSVCKDSEESDFADVCNVIETIGFIISKDWITAEDTLDTPSMINQNSNDDGSSPGPVIFAGVHVILSLTSPELLNYPSFCDHYYKLILNLCEVYPQKVAALSADALQILLGSVQSGLNLYGSNNCKMCLDIIGELAEYCRKTQNHPTVLHEGILQFIKIIFYSILNNCGDLDMLSTAGEAFYCLLCFQPQRTFEVLNCVLQNDVNANHQSKIAQAFQELMSDLNSQQSQRENRMLFLKKFEAMVLNIRGVLVVK